MDQSVSQDQRRLTAWAAITPVARGTQLGEVARVVRVIAEVARVMQSDVVRSRLNTIIAGGMMVVC